MKSAADEITIRLDKAHIKDLIGEVVEPFYQAILNDPETKHYVADENMLRGLKIKQSTFTVCFFAYPLEKIMDKVKKSSSIHYDIDLKMEYFTKYFFVWAELVKRYINNALHTKEEHELRAWEVKLQKLLWIMASHYRNSNVIDMQQEIEKLEEEIENELFYKNKISAKDFLEEHGADTDTIEELGELYRELKNTYEEKELDTQVFDETLEGFGKYAHVLDVTIEFRDLGFAFARLCDELKESEQKMLHEDNKKFVKVFFESIIEDLESWRRLIFIEKSAKDIHYLDDSLFSSIAQLELIIEGNGTNNEEDIFF